MNISLKTIPFYFLLALSTYASAQDKIELDTTVIKGNTELPKILYIVPWQDTSEQQKGEQKLTLHSLFGDLFDPVTPEAPNTILKQ